MQMHRYRARILHIPVAQEFNEEFELPTGPQAQQWFLLWRLGLRVHRVKVAMNNGADVDDDSDEEIPELSPDADTDEEEAYEAAVQRKHFQELARKHAVGNMAHPRGANAVFLRRALMSGWRSLAK